MMKPLHRSLTFWSGIVVLVFIVFLWADSMRESTYLVARRSQSTFPGTSIVSIFSRGKMLLTAGLLTGDPGPHEWSFDHERTRSDFTEDWPDGFSAGLRSDDLIEHPLKRVTGELSCPFWQVAVAWILLWLGLLVWRCRRRRRLAATGAIPEADPA